MAESVYIRPGEIEGSFRYLLGQCPALLADNEKQIETEKNPVENPPTCGRNNGMGDYTKKREAELALIAKVAEQCKTAVITGPAAARWMGLSTLKWVEKVDLVLPGNSRTWGTKYRDKVYHGGILRDEETCTVKRVRSAIGVRAMFDTFRYYGRLDALVQIESARWQHAHLTVETLLEKTEVLPQARGLKSFRGLIRGAGETSASVLETLVRDRLLGAINYGHLTGVETIEFQVGYQIVDELGNITVAWVDCIINQFIVVEADGAEKTSGAMGDALSALRSERHREKQLQNKGAVFFRVGWDDVFGPRMVRQLQGLINLNPGVRPMDGRLDIGFREWSRQIGRMFA